MVSSKSKSYGVPVKPWFVVSLCFAAFAVIGLASAALGPLLPNFAAAYAVPLASVGVLRSSRQIGQFFAVLLGGRALDQVDLRAVMLPGALVMGLGLVILGTSNLLWLAVAGALLWGLGHGLIHVVPHVAFGRLLGSSASFASTAMHTIYGAGAIIGPFVVLLAMKQASWQLALYGIAFATVLIGIVFALTHFEATRDKTTPTPETADAPKVAVGWTALLPFFVLIFVFNGANAGIADWIYVHAELVASANANAAAQITSLYWIGITGGRLLSMIAMQKLSDRRVLWIGVLIALVGSACIISYGSQVSFLALGVGLVGLGYAPIYPIVMILGGQQQPAARGTITGVMAGVAAAGAVTIPVIQGWVGGGQSGGMVVTFVASAAMAFTLLAFSSKRGI